MDHRRFLARPDAHRPFAGGDLLARVGGRAAVEALIDGLYDRIETDAALRTSLLRRRTLRLSCSSPCSRGAAPPWSCCSTAEST